MPDRRDIEDQTTAARGEPGRVAGSKLAAGDVLGVKTRQLNNGFVYPGSGVQDNQLRTWSHIGLFHQSLDEAAIADYITELMKGLQHKVTTFTEPGAALEFTVENAESIDLVITDHTMPTISGLDLASRVHATRESLPVLICPEQELTFREDEQLFQCQKPLDINELIQIVSDLV